MPMALDVEVFADRKQISSNELEELVQEVGIVDFNELQAPFVQCPRLSSASIRKLNWKPLSAWMVDVNAEKFAAVGLQ